MPYSETEAIVLKKFKYGDTSLIATIFTKDYGKFNIIAKGVRSPKSKYIGVLETINNIKIIFNKKETRELQVVSKVDLLNSYPNIKKEIEKLLISFRIIELINKLFYQYDKSENSFVLLKNTLNYIEKNSIEPSVLLLYFQIKVAENIGVPIIHEKSQYKVVKDETFDYDIQYNLDRNDFRFLQNLYNQEFNTLSKIEININMVNKLIDYMDIHLLSNYYSDKSLPSKQSIYQIENFKLKEK